MDQNECFEAPVPQKSNLSRGAARQATALLRRRGNTAFLIATLLFALVVTFAWLTLFGLIETVIAFSLGEEIEYRVYFTAELLVGLFRWLTFFALVVPVWVGRWRTAGLVALGKKPSLIEVLHYFTSWRRYRRAVHIGLQFVFCTLLPVAICIGLFILSVLLYRDVFYVEFETCFAVILLVLCLLGALLVSAILFIATGSYATVTAVAIGNESLSMRQVWRIACGNAWRRLGSVLAFRLRVLWHVLLSVLTLGTLFVVCYAHHMILSYMRLSMALCPKGDPQ